MLICTKQRRTQQDTIGVLESRRYLLVLLHNDDLHHRLLELELHDLRPIERNNMGVFSLCAIVTYIVFLVRTTVRVQYGHE